MGNRAVITNKHKKFGIYVHWNGGRESIEGFLKAAKELGYRDLESDPAYGFARLTGAICAFFGMTSEYCVGVGPLDELDCDNYDNGVYVVDKDWKVVERYGEGAPENAKEDPDWEIKHPDYDKAEAESICREVVEKCRAADRPAEDK